MVLTYMEPYGQLDLLKENSTAYSMAFFQPMARIEIHYTRDKSKYLSLNQRAFEVAQANGFREPLEISYYGSNGKLILKLERNEYETFDICRYSASDMPQLLNSTLLYTQSEEVLEDRMTSQQIEVTYNSEGLPETRRLNPYIYNVNGINGEYYVYDERGGNRTDIWYVDTEGDYMTRRELGYAHVHSEYDERRNNIHIWYYDEERKVEECEEYMKWQIHKQLGYASVEYTYDPWGKTTDWKCYNSEGELLED